MPGSQSRDENLRARVAHLEDELETLTNQNRPATQARQSERSGIGRRGLMAGGGLGLLGLLAASGNAAGAVDPSDGDGDIGSGGPMDYWADGLALVAEDVSTSTTVTKPIVRYDSALSSLTLQIDSSLEGPSGFGQPMWFLDQSGNAGSNPVTVQNSSGGTVATIPASNSIFAIVWDGSEWLTDWFIPTVDAGSVTAERVVNSDLGDGVNYIDPRWFARTDAFFRNLSFRSFDQLTANGSGSGSVSQSTSLPALLDTGATSGSVAEILASSGGFQRDFDKDRSFRVGFQIVDSASGRTDYVTTGDLIDDTFGFGFKVSGGDLLGVTGDGASEVTTTLISGVGTGIIDGRAEFEAGSQVTFYVDGVQEGAISTNLPSGSAGASNDDFRAYVTNSVAEQRRLFHLGGWVVQAP